MLVIFFLMELWRQCLLFLILFHAFFIQYAHLRRYFEIGYWLSCFLFSCRIHILQKIIAHIAQTGTIIVPLSSADNSLFVQITAPVPLGTLALSNTLNTLVSSVGGEAVFFIAKG